MFLQTKNTKPDGSIKDKKHFVKQLFLYVCCVFLAGDGEGWIPVSFPPPTCRRNPLSVRQPAPIDAKFRAVSRPRLLTAPAPPAPGTILTAPFFSGAIDCGISVRIPEAAQNQRTADPPNPYRSWIISAGANDWRRNRVKTRQGRVCREVRRRAERIRCHAFRNWRLRGTARAAPATPRETAPESRPASSPPAAGRP